MKRTIGLVLFLLCSSLLMRTALAQPVPDGALVTYQVNINEAGADELAEGLDGIGPARAREIVADRERHGPFRSVDDLARVKGIGMATVERNRAMMRVD